MDLKLKTCESVCIHLPFFVSMQSPKGFRHVGKIPCFRSSLIYGIWGGAAVGVLWYMKSSECLIVKAAQN